MGKQSATQTRGSFIHELRLMTTPHDLQVLDTRLDVARQLYNACLGEALKRLSLVRQSQLYHKASASSTNKKRQALFKEVNKIYAFTDYALQDYVLMIRKNNWLGEHIDSLTAQKLAKRAYSAVQQHAFGLRGKPRFKTKNRLSSIEGKNNASGIRWKSNIIHWSGLSIKPMLDLKDKSGLEAYALSHKTKYVRLVKRIIKNESIWYAQFVQEGKPYIKPKYKSQYNIVGLDIGPSTIAAVNNDSAVLEVFCDNVVVYDAKIKRMQRKINRLMRVLNPDNYTEDRYIRNANSKTIKKLGKSKTNVVWRYSNHCQRLKAEVKELHRKMAGARNSSHGALANRILQMGNVVKIEKLSYKSFQILFGKSVGKRSPSTFVSKIRYKAENAGGVLYEFNTCSTALSQTCVCGRKEKKPLKQRWHTCSQCGAFAQRDLFSANLARYVENNRLDTSQAQKAWAGVDTLLAQTVSRLNETASGKSKQLASFGLSQRQSCLSVKEKSAIDKALDDVGVCREPKRVNSFVLRTP